MELRDLAEQAGDALEGAARPRRSCAGPTTSSATRWCVASSMGDAVMAHLASRVRPGVDVLFLDTGYHFAETIGTRDAVAATLAGTVRTLTPEAHRRAAGRELRAAVVRAQS